jgi:hypothetical protein
MSSGDVAAVTWLHENNQIAEQPVAEAGDIRCLSATSLVRSMILQICATVRESDPSIEVDG